MTYLFDRLRTFVCAQTAAQQMVAQGQGGAIVSVSSILDREVLEGGAAYVEDVGDCTLRTVLGSARALAILGGRLKGDAAAPAAILRKDLRRRSRMAISAP
jgi:hypothetical protein